MPISDLLASGIQLMLMGMGIVFVFLFILVFAMMLMSKISFFFDDIEEAVVQAPQQTPLKKPENTALIAVITAAITRYRSAHN